MRSNMHDTVQTRKEKRKKKAQQGWTKRKLPHDTNCASEGIHHVEGEGAKAGVVGSRQQRRVADVQPWKRQPCGWGRRR